MKTWNKVLGILYKSYSKEPPKEYWQLLSRP